VLFVNDTVGGVTNAFIYVAGSYRNYTGSNWQSTFLFRYPL